MRSLSCSRLAHRGQVSWKKTEMGKRKADDPSPALSGGKTQQPEEDWLHDEDPLAEALRIDDLRSEYCQQLENRIAELSAEVEVLRALLARKERAEREHREERREEEEHRAGVE